MAWSTQSSTCGKATSTPGFTLSETCQAWYLPSGSAPTKVASYSSASRDSSRSPRRVSVPPIRSRSVRRSQRPVAGSYIQRFFSMRR